jgi:hypothetical protein
VITPIMARALDRCQRVKHNTAGGPETNTAAISDMRRRIMGQWSMIARTRALSREAATVDVALEIGNGYRHREMDGRTESHRKAVAIGWQESGSGQEALSRNIGNFRFAQDYRPMFI